MFKPSFNGDLKRVYKRTNEDGDRSRVRLEPVQWGLNEPDVSDRWKLLHESCGLLFRENKKLQQNMGATSILFSTTC